MKTLRFTITLVVTLIAASSALAQSKSDQIDKLLKSYHDYGQLNGAVLVADGGKVVFKKGYGMANMEWNVPVQTDTKFRIGSVTKQFTAALILQLVEQGKIKLDGKITDYLTDYRKDTGDRVTIHQLLNHTSGIPSYTSLPVFGAESRNPYEVKAFVKKFASGDIEFEPGSKYSYNNSGYFLLGAIIEQVTGKPFATVLRENILDPLGMKDSGFDDDTPLIARRAAGYSKTPEGYENAPYLEMQLPYAAGSMYSTVEDLFKWEQALYEDKILSAASKKLMFSPGLEKYGYGVVITDQALGNTKEKAAAIFHGGGINGFNSLLTRLIDRRASVIILDNVGQGRYQGRMTEAIAGILYDRPFDAPKRSIAEALYKVAIEKGGVAAVSEYRKLKAAKPNEYDFAEGELNTLGYQIMRRDRTKDAIEIFKLNVEMFPAAFNPYDSLGEAYLADGQKELALTNYKKSVELNPENTNGIRYIKQIEGKDAKVDPSVFDAYVGDYELAPNFILTITREGDTLIGQATGQGKLRLEPVSEVQYTVSAVGADLTFEKGADGKVTGLTLVQGGRTTKGRKIK